MKPEIKMATEQLLLRTMTIKSDSSDSSLLSMVVIIVIIIDDDIT